MYLKMANLVVGCKRNFKYFISTLTDRIEYFLKAVATLQVYRTKEMKGVYLMYISIVYIKTLTFK